MPTDISIEDLRKAMVRPDVSARARANDIKKAQEFLSDPSIKIVEKIDGTKLTLVRRNNEFDPNDYSRNWYVAYRGNIIYPGEARKLSAREEEIRSASSGTAQYALVHAHLARVHPGTMSIPPGTEFFLEFVQRKPTISREYPQKHGIFLTLFGPTRYKATGAHLVSNISPVDDESKLEEYARILDIRTYPVLFEGSLATLLDLRAGIKSNAIEQEYVKHIDKLRAAYDDKTQDKPLRIVDAIYGIFSRFNTVLSSETDEDRTAEGSVFRTSISKALYKALHPTGHDDAHRASVKLKYRADSPEQEQSYWNGIIAIADEIAAEQVPSQRRNIPESDLDKVLEAVHQECYFDAAISNRLGRLIHPQKESLIQRQEDLFLTTKARVMKRLEIGIQNGISIGIFVVAGKPVHAGHWQMIDIIRKECDEALIITSSAGRDELAAGVMIDAWKAVLEPQFHKDFPNATLIITSESPLDLAINKMRDLKNVVNRFVFYSDPEDLAGKYAPDKLRDRIKDPVAIEKLQQVAIPRTETVQISGTRMREFIKNDDRESFDHFVPQALSPEMKDNYWKIVRGEQVNITDGVKRKSVLMYLWENLEKK